MKKKPSFFILALLTAGMNLAMPEKAQTAVVNVFDDFLFDNLQQPGNNLNGPVASPQFRGILEWQVTGGSVDLVGPPGLGVINFTSRYIDLGGSTGDPGLFSYALPLVLAPNVPYTLSFLYNSVDGKHNSMTVNVAGQTFTVSSSTKEFKEFSVEVTFPQPVLFGGVPLDSIANSPLTFQDHGIGHVNSGIGLDRVSLAPSTNLPPVDLNADLNIDLPGFQSDTNAGVKIDPPAVNVPGLVPRL